MDLMLEEIDTVGKNVIILGEGPGKTTKRFPRASFFRGTKTNVLQPS